MLDEKGGKEETKTGDRDLETGAEGKIQTSEREGKLMEMKLGQNTIDTHSPYNSLIKLFLNYHRVVKPLFFPFYCSPLQFEQLPCVREA